MNSFNIGDVIEWAEPFNLPWNSTIIDVDTSRPLEHVELSDGSSISFKSEILFRRNNDGVITDTWMLSIDNLNRLIDAGQVIIVKRNIEPIQKLENFKLK